MFVLLYRLCTHVRLDIFVTGLSVYILVGVDGMNTCKTSFFGNKHFCLCFLLLYRLCTHVRLGHLEMSVCVYVCVVV